MINHAFLAVCVGLLVIFALLVILGLVLLVNRPRDKELHNTILATVLVVGVLAAVVVMVASGDWQ